ncbi:MAG: PSD1 and planctomycete cytochrome C domain-containing protein [Bryobacteraceae bacterium]
MPRALKLAWLAPLAALPLAGAEATNPAEFFELNVRPVLARSCYGCHTEARSGGLRLDSRGEILKGGNSGAAIMPGDAEHSLLIQAVSQTHERLKMPPGGKLKESEIANLKAWVNGGAVWPDTTPASSQPKYQITAEQRAYWAFQPVREPTPPSVRNSVWAKTPIDRFILAALEQHGLEPAQPAGKRALIRRATFDLTGLPPTPEEVDAFLNDAGPNAFSRVVDRLLASPHYGERWGRYWLDVSRYSDDKLDSERDNPYANAFRYRDWVIQALNDDMPYNAFVKAQIAGDLLPEPERSKSLAGLGFYALSPEFQDDRVDATSRGFLGLTVACAQCHNHKFDPIPTQDYYSLLGIFNNTEIHEYPLAPDDVVAAYRARKEKIEKGEKELKEYVERQGDELAGILAGKTTRYMLAARKLSKADGLDGEVLERWQRYLDKKTRKHPYLKLWDELVARDAATADFEKAAREFQDLVLAVNEEKKLIDQKNRITLGLNPSRDDLSSASLLSLERDKFVLWEDIFDDPHGVLSFGTEALGKRLQGEWKEHLERLQADVKEWKAALPPQYPFLHGIAEAPKFKTQRIYLRGNQDSLGDEAPPRFLAILSGPARTNFSHGSGRLELAEAITDPRNPLTARVMVNRIWQHHFGQGLVRTPSNFGQLGDRPSHPELLDYLAARFVAGGWSIKAMHREIMLSAAYQESADYSEKAFAIDPENRFLWRANRRRLDVESLRDSLLFVAGDLDPAAGGPASRLGPENKRRTVYGYVSRRKLDGMLALFDFPNPNNTSESRMTTNVPLQRLFFMNGDLVATASKDLVRRVGEQGGDRERIRRAYRLVYERHPSAEEMRLGLEFLRSGNWNQYAQVLLSSNEVSYVD